MANLLDRSSLVLTPTAFNNGEALCIKPDDASGDFQFSRNSAATRVNAQGLVENVQILSSNLVQNGDFSEEGVEEVSNGSFSQEGAELVTNGDFTNNIDGWISYGSVSTWDDGTIKTTCTSNTAWIRQNSVVTANKYYKVTFKAKASNISQNIKIYNGSTFIDTGLSFDEVDVYQEFTYYLYTTVTQIIIGQQSVSVGSTINFDNVSVREVGQDWSLGTGWSIGDGVASQSGGNATLQQSEILTANKIYKLVFEITEITNGSVRCYFGGNYSTYRSSTGTHTEYITNGSTSTFFIQGNASFSGSVTNISVKEVGQNWNFGTGWSIGNGVAISDGVSADSNLNTNNIGYSVGDLLKVSFSVSNVTGGSLQIGLGANQTYSGITDGDYEFITTATRPDGKVFFKSILFNGSITNISVIEITTDTSLPRINYEGFSYQDALGSELVLNGDFATDSNWSKGTGWSISGGVSTANNVPNLQRLQNTGNAPSVIGSTYKYSIDVSNVSGFYSFYIYGVYALSTVNTEGTIEGYVTATSTNGAIFVAAASAGGLISATIDNVSVKEYLGQEVVPGSGCGSYLWEPQSTNLVTDSQNYNSTYWGGQRGTLSDGGVGLFYLSPTSNVIKYEVTTTGFNQLYYRLPSAVTIGNTYTQQGYVKCDDAPYIIFQIQPLTGNPSIVWDNINNVVISSDPSIDSFNITSLNGWVKAEITYTATVASIYASLKTYFSTTTSNTQGVPIGTIAYQTFVQVEQNSFSTSYIPTEGSTVTRNQDVCTNGGSLASINSTSGTLYAEIAALNQTANVSQYITISDGTYNNRASILFSNGSTNSIRTFLRVGGVPQIDVSNAVSDVTDFNKIAFSYKENNFKIYLNGVLVSTDTSGSVWSADTITKLSFSEINTTGGAFFGKTKALAVWKEALSDSELQSLTTI